MMAKNTVLSRISERATGKKSSDGCTNSPDFDFHDCCEKHDHHYSKLSKMPRFIADLRLAYCIYKKGHLLLALFYFAAVRKYGESHYEAQGDHA